MRETYTSAVSLTPSAYLQSKFKYSQASLCFSYPKEPYSRSALSWSHGGLGREKKDAESSKTASSPYKRTAETGFGGRKSENIKLHAGIRKDSDPLSALWDKLKTNNLSLFSLFRSALF